jgi:NADH-ubiquinone oxidoreductase chain 2
MLLYSLLFLLLSNAVTFRRDKSILYNRITIIILLLTIFTSLEIFELTSLNKGIGLFNGLFYTTAITTVFQIFIFLLSALILQLTAFYPRKVWIKQFSGVSSIFKKLIYYEPSILNKMGEQYKIIEYPLILLFIISGACFLISSSDIVSIFLSIELQSYGLYLLCTLYRNSELSTSAGLTYFLLGGLSSCFILLGSSMLYINTGTTNLDNFYIINNLYDLIKNNTESLTLLYNINYIDFSLLIMSVGFLFKISAAPFHF